MDKSLKKTEQKNKNFFNFKNLARIFLVVCIVVGLVLVCIGSARVHKYKASILDKPVEELSVDIESLSGEYEEIEKEKLDEYEANGFSDKYFELNSKSAEISKKISQATGSRYVKEKGKTIDTFGDYLNYAPEITAGLVVIVVGFVGFFACKIKINTDKAKK
ncbi:hypothetical protein IJ768_00670 [Candidatus Saccharibacteria bacterium]|nr:hypothetical protein [Candidatus Saccharibacteria bacterium]